MSIPEGHQVGYYIVGDTVVQTDLGPEKRTERQGGSGISSKPRQEGGLSEEAWEVLNNAGVRIGPDNIQDLLEWERKKMSGR